MNEKQLLLTVQRHFAPLTMKFYAAFEILFTKRKSLIPYKTDCFINEKNKLKRTSNNFMVLEVFKMKST